MIFILYVFIPAVKSIFTFFSAYRIMLNLTQDVDRYNATDTRLLQFYRRYAGVHGYVSVCVCLFGFVTNMFNVTGQNA